MVEEGSNVTDVPRVRRTTAADSGDAGTATWLLTARGVGRALVPAGRLGLLAAALLLLYTGIVKASDSGSFAQTLGAQSLLPQRSLAALSIALPATEIILRAGAIVALAFARGQAIAAVAQAAPFLVFMTYAAAMDAKPPPEPTGCGCGLRTGPIKDWSPLVVQNGACAAMLGLAGYVLRRRIPPTAGSGPVASGAGFSGDGGLREGRSA
jgi:hypothetical protein